MATIDTPLKETQETVRIPIWQGNRDTTFRQTFINCYPKKEHNPITGSDAFHIVRRPGISVASYPSNTVNWAPYVNNPNKCAWLGVCGFATGDNLVVGAVFDGSNGTIYVLSIPMDYVSAPVLIGTITGFSAPTGSDFYCTADFIHLTEISFSPANVPILGLTIGQYAIGGITRGYTATTSGGVFTAASLTQIAAAGFPANIAGTQITGPFVQMQNFVFIATRKGAIYWSNSASATLWTALDNINAMTDTDFLFGLGKYKHHLLAYGDRTLEFFNVEYENTTGAILIPTVQAKIRVGVPNSYGWVQVSDTLYFIGKTDSANVSMYRMDGYSPVKIKNIENVIVQDLRYVSKYYPKLQVVSIGGTQHICLNVPGKSVPSPLPYEWVALSEDQETLLFDDYPDEYCSYFDNFGYSFEEIESQISYTPFYDEGVLMFAVETEELWTLSFFSPLRNFNYSQSLVGILAGSPIFSTDYSTSSNITHLWVANQTYTQAFVTSTPFTVFLPNSTEDFQGVHKDASPNMDREADYGGWPISVYLSSEYMDFGTSKRKKIHRLTLEGDNRNNWSLWDESLRIFWKKDEMGDSVGSQQPTDNDEWTFGKTIPLPTPKRPRWSIANLGSARTWAFGFWIVTASNIQLRSWEVEVSKGAS